jgi:hypothetical protein
MALDQPLSPFHPKIKDIDAALQKEGLEVPLFRISRLARLADYFEAGRFHQRSPIEKKECLENLLELKNEGALPGIRIFLGVALRRQDDPQWLESTLAETFRKEKNEDIKAMIMKMMMPFEEHLKNWISPDDLVPGLWSNDPLFRHQTTACLIRHYSPQTVIDAVVRETMRSGREFPVKILRKFVDSFEYKKSLNKKRKWIATKGGNPSLNDEEVIQLWTDYLNGLNRYELINLLTMENKPSPWRKILEKRAPQLSIQFEISKDPFSKFNTLQKRIQAVGKASAKYENRNI